VPTISRLPYLRIAPRICSGLMYAGVPTKSSSSTILAIPTPSTLRISSGVLVDKHQVQRLEMENERLDGSASAAFVRNGDMAVGCAST
jgi:hypothetical protein